MPKEGTHQYIAQKSWVSSIPKIETAYLYGAVAPDIFFFDFFKRSITSDRLHGKNGEAVDDIFVGLNNIWTKLDKSDQEILAAFLAGYITHIVADRTFHPWVIYWSGGVAAEKKYGSAAHHYIETVLDIEVKNIKPKINYNQRILDLYQTIAKPANNIWRCAWQHKFIVANLDNPILLALSRHQPALLALSYKVCQKYRQQFPLEALDTWQHPVTGVQNNLSYQDLLVQAIQASSDILKKINWQDLPNNDWHTLVGPATLETNMVGVPFSDCHYQDNEYFKNLL